MRQGLDMDYFRTRLEARLLSLADNREKLKSDMVQKELDQTCVGRLSRMDSMQQQAMFQAAARLADQERQRVLHALESLRSGDYGYCMLCDEEISEKRLRFDPSVLTCISCARGGEGA